jgi:hypothetical protein
MADKSFDICNYGLESILARDQPVCWCGDPGLRGQISRADDTSSRLTTKLNGVSLCCSHVLAGPKHFGIRSSTMTTISQVH